VPRPMSVRKSFQKHWRLLVKAAPLFQLSTGWPLRRHRGPKVKEYDPILVSADGKILESDKDVELMLKPGLHLDR